MNQKSSLREDPQFVSAVLTGNILGFFNEFCDRFDKPANRPMQLLFFGRTF